MSLPIRIKWWLVFFALNLYSIAVVLDRHRCLLSRDMFQNFPGRVPRQALQHRAFNGHSTLYVSCLQAQNLEGSNFQGCTPLILASLGLSVQSGNHLQARDCFTACVPPAAFDARLAPLGLGPEGLQLLPLITKDSCSAVRDFIAVADPHNWPKSDLHALGKLPYVQNARHCTAIWRQQASLHNAIMCILQTAKLKGGTQPDAT